MGGVVEGIFGGDEPDYVGDNIEAQRKALEMAMTEGRTLANEQYPRNIQAAYDTAALNRFNQVTPYSSLTWYNTNDPREAQEMAEADRLNQFVNKMVGGAINADYDTIANTAKQYLDSSNPEAARAAMNAIQDGSMMQQATKTYNDKVADRERQLNEYREQYLNLPDFAQRLASGNHFNYDTSFRDYIADTYNVNPMILQGSYEDIDKLIAPIRTAQAHLADTNQQYMAQKAAKATALAQNPVVAAHPIVEAPVDPTPAPQQNRGLMNDKQSYLQQMQRSSYGGGI